MNTRKPDLKYNASSCVDNTSFEALQNVGRHERRELICKIKELARDYGYRIVSTIKLKEIESDNNG